MATLPAADAPTRSPLGSAIVIALVLLLAYQLAHWAWAFLAPPRVSAAPAHSAGEVDLAAIARMFGAAPPAGSATSASTLRLKGVIAPTPGVAASAIFSTGAARDVAVFVEHEVQPG